MTEIVIEHVNVEDLPAAWQAKLPGTGSKRVTVRIEPEPSVFKPEANFATDDPAFGIWRDRTDIADIDAHVDQLRAPRYRGNGSRNTP